MIDQVAAEVGARRVAIAFHDWETATAGSVRGDEWFHAASVVKVAVLLALVRAVGEGKLDWDAWLHVRNRFASRVDAEPYRIARERDADGVTHAEVGKLMRVGELAERMIVASGNLATNLLLDLLGVPESKATLAALGIEGVDLVRGVEDHRAAEAGINNRLTAMGVMSMLRLLVEPGPLGEAPAKQAVDLLVRQELVGAIGLALPEGLRGRAKVAHKTGEITTVAHDAGIVFLPDRAPLALVVLSEWPAAPESRQAAVARVVAEVYRHVLGIGEPVEVVVP